MRSFFHIENKRSKPIEVHRKEKKIVHCKTAQRVVNKNSLCNVYNCSFDILDILDILYYSNCHRSNVDALPPSAIFLASSPQCWLFFAQILCGRLHPFRAELSPALLPRLIRRRLHSLDIP